MKPILVPALLMLGIPALAATVKPDSLLCERDVELATVAAEPWARKGATEALRQAKLHADFYAGSAQLAGIKKNLAADEERIRADANLSLSNGGNAARATAAAADGASATSKSDSYRLVATSCASSGSTPLEAQVIDRRPISGFIKIKIQFHGAGADLWASDSAIDSGGSQ